MNAQGKRSAATNALFNINAGLHALRKAIEARCPSDFDWEFAVDREEVRLTYLHRGGVVGDVRAASVGEALLLWQALKWDDIRVEVAS